MGRGDRPTSPREFSTGPATTMVQALEFSPDGRYLAAADHDRKVRLWNVADGSRGPPPGRPARDLGSGLHPRRPAAHHCEHGGGRKGLGRVRPADGRASRSAPTPVLLVTGWRSVRDRRLLALGCEDGTIKIVATDPLKEVRTLDAHTGEISGMAFGAGDERLASTGDDLIVKVWDLRTGQQSLSLDIVERRANGLAFSPDGQRLAVGSADGVVQILDGTPLTGLATPGRSSLWKATATRSSGSPTAPTAGGSPRRAGTGPRRSGTPTRAGKC